jgi:hypothetical protein
MAVPVNEPMIETQLLYFPPAVRKIRQQLGFINPTGG